MYRIVFTLIACWICAQMLANHPIELHVKQSGNSYQLMWIPKSWNTEWQGVSIAYRTTGTSTWTYWNTEPVLPGIYSQRDLGKQGITPAREIALESKYGFFVQNNNMPPEVFRNALATTDGGLPPREILCMHQDFDCALAMGLGAIVNLNNLVGIYEFALFPVLNNGNTGSNPVGFHSTIDRTALFLSSITHHAAGSINAIKIDWKIPLQLWKESKIFGFNVYHINNGKIQLLQEAVGNIPVNGNTVNYAYTFETDQVNKSHVFSLAPITLFKEELVHIQVEYTPEPKEDDSILVAEFQLPVSNSMEGNPVINVNAKNLPATTQSISIERYNSIAGDFKIIAQNLLPQTVFWTDTELLEFGLSYTYRIVAVTADERLVYSNTQTVVNFGSPKPPPVNNITAEIIKRGDEVFARLRWQPLLHQKPAIKGYRILSDVHEPGKFVLHSNIPVITGNQYNFPLTGAFSNKNVTFQVVAITELSQSGDEGGLATLKIPSLSLPPPSSLSIANIEQNAIHITWQYIANRVFDGFEVEVNGQRVAEARQIPADATSFKIENPKPDSRGNVEVKIYAVNSITKSRPATISRRLPDFFLIPGLLQPTGITVKKVKEGDEVYAEFTWKKAPEEFGGIGFLLHADTYVPGRPTPMNAVPIMKTSPYRYKLPDTERDQYLFEIKTITENNKHSPGLKLILPLK